MKIQSTQPESESQLLNPTALPTTFPSELFSLLIQNMSELLTKAEELTQESSNNMELITDQPAKLAEDDILYTQLNFINQSNDKYSSDIGADKKIQNDPVDEMIINQAQSHLEDSPIKPVANTITTLERMDIKEPDLIDLEAVDAKPIVAPKPAAESKQSNVIPAINTVPESTNKVNQTDIKSFLNKEVMTTDNDVITDVTIDSKEIVSRQNPEINPSSAYVNSKSPAIQNAMTKIKLPDIVHQLKEVEVLPDLVKPIPLESKPLDFFVQLSQFINNQTTQQPSFNEGGGVQTKSIENAPLLDHSEYKLNIELINPEETLKGAYEAKIKIYPPELGSVIAKLKMTSNNAELVILTENNHVKHIVESNLPLLRQHFQNANFNLTDIQVQTAQTSDESHNNRNSQYKDQLSNSNFSNETPKTEEYVQKSTKSSSIIDTYV